MMEYLYCELVKGNVQRFKVVDETDSYFQVEIPGYDGVVLVPKALMPEVGIGLDYPLAQLWPESKEWEARYQDSLSIRVSQRPLTVYMVMPIKRGKFNSRVLVIDGAGVTYNCLVPTVPLPVLGQQLQFLRMDLEPVSLVPAHDILEKVMKARKDV
jgi:hypothetical protein